MKPEAMQLLPIRQLNQSDKINEWNEILLPVYKAKKKKSIMSKQPAKREASIILRKKDFFSLPIPE